MHYEIYIDEEGHAVKAWDGGIMEWRKNGLLHRDGDKPAVVFDSGGKQWYKNGYMHRENNYAYINGNAKGICGYYLLSEPLVTKTYWIKLLLMEY